MARQRSPLNKQTPLGSNLNANNAQSGAKKARSAHKSLKGKSEWISNHLIAKLDAFSEPLYHFARRNALARKRGPRSTFEADNTLFDPIAAGLSDDEDSLEHEESSEGEDWEDGNTLVSKFMEVELE